MRTYTFSGGQVRTGITTRPDERLGQVVFLGEEGRGRRYGKVALDQRNPPEVNEQNIILAAKPRKVTLPAKDGKPEKVFYVLERSDTESDAVLVRINTLTSYVRDGRGYWKVVAGQPEDLISGYGAFGDAGRIGNWDDGLVLMRSGDVLKVFPSRGGASALWIDDKGKPQAASWQDYENILALEKAEATIVEASSNPVALDVVAGNMPAYTWHRGQITKGLKVSQGATGKVVAVGENGRGRSLIEYPIVQANADAVLAEAAVVELDRKEVPARYSFEQPTTKVIYGLTQSDSNEDGFLVRVNTQWVYTRDTMGKFEAWKGNPTILSCGHGAHGDAGRIGGWKDGFVVMHEGDVLFVSPEGGRKTSNYALWVEDGQIQTDLWSTWKINDAIKDPSFYVEKGTAPWGHVPNEWIGRIVTVLDFRGERDERRMIEIETGELVLINENGQISLNLGWNGMDRLQQIFQHGVWVKLEKDKEVRRIEGEALAERDGLKDKAKKLQGQAEEIITRPHFGLLSGAIQEKIKEIATSEFSLMPTHGDWSDGLDRWVLEAEKTLVKLAEQEPAAIEMLSRQNAGEVLANFEAGHRRGGMTGNGDGWVILPDGTFRLRDSDDVPRHKNDGRYHWNLIQPEELALRWCCGHMGDVTGSSQFGVAHMPVDGLTLEQKEAVRLIEEQIGAPAGSFGLDEGLSQLYEERFNTIMAATTEILGYTPVAYGAGYHQVSGANGIGLENWGQLVINSSGISQCDNREATIVSQTSVAGGTLEFVTYDKYGHDNLAMRWRDEPCPEAQPAKKSSEQEVSDSVDLGAALQQLQARFNGS